MKKLESRKTDKDGKKLIVSLELDKDILAHYGDANLAILYSNIRFWCLHNEDKDKDTHFHDGRWWTYNTREGFATQFPFWGAKKIYGMLNKLEQDGFIKKGSFNKLGFDRTSWYAITE